MRLTYGEKLKMYRMWKHEGYGYMAISKIFNYPVSNVRYLIHLIDRYGAKSVKHGKNKYYSQVFKEYAILRVLENGESIFAVALDIGLPSRKTLIAWIKSYKENGYTVVGRKRGRHGQKETENYRGTREWKPSLEGRELEAYYRESIHKKIKCLSYTKRKIAKEDMDIEEFIYSYWEKDIPLIIKSTTFNEKNGVKRNKT